MVEMRWFLDLGVLSGRVLQYRVLGEPYRPNQHERVRKWSEWKDVPVVPAVMPPAATRDTPRTDAAVVAMDHVRGAPVQYVAADFARQLEHELTEAKRLLDDASRGYLYQPNGAV